MSCHCFFVSVSRIIFLALCPTVHLLELHPQKSVRAIQKDRQLLFLGHIFGPGKYFIKLKNCNYLIPLRNLKEMYLLFVQIHQKLYKCL